jgi:PsbP
MKINIHKFLVFAVLLFVVLGCSSFMEGFKKGYNKSAEGETKVMTSTDGTYQLTVPGDWTTQTDLNSLATLQAANPGEELYVIVIKESRAGFPKSTNLDAVTKVVRDNMKTTVTNAQISEPVSVNINGNNGKQFEVAGTISGLQAKYLYAVIETTGNFYQIMTWTLAPRFDANKTKLQNVINSFKEK